MRLPSQNAGCTWFSASDGVVVRIEDRGFGEEEREAAAGPAPARLANGVTWMPAVPAALLQKIAPVADCACAHPASSFWLCP